MIIFKSEKYDDCLVESEKRKVEIGTEIVRLVLEAIDNKENRVVVAKFQHFRGEMACEKHEYVQALEANLKYCELSEEYEMCAKALKYINKSKQN